MKVMAHTKRVAINEVWDDALTGVSQMMKAERKLFTVGMERTELSEQVQAVRMSLLRVVGLCKEAHRELNKLMAGEAEEAKDAETGAE